ncbi:MAG: c-type cytochrome [Magnetococcales bacterium]|nr:c-type cytochrome [Magnetococcales bacterium]
MHYATMRTVTAVAAGLLIGSLSFGSTSAWAGATAEMLSNTCAGCHGTNGISAGPGMPTIAGFPADHTKQVMQQFKNGERFSTIMGRIAKGYSDEEIVAMANFFAKQPWQNAVNNPNSKMATAVDAKQAAAGQKLVKQCEKCHEENGRAQGEGVPRMAGQWLDYILVKMKDYKDASIKPPIPQEKKMAAQIEKLSLDELTSIAHFYASQK